MYLFGLLPFLLLALIWSLRLTPARTWLETVSAALPIFLALMVAGVAIPGNWLQGFSSAYWTSSALCLGLCAIFLLRRGLVLPQGKVRPGKEDISWILLLVVITGLVSIVTVRLAIFDEVRLQGHIPVVEAMLRGHFPPSYIAFPDVQFRYHYGFNILAALFSLGTGTPAHVGIDIATLVCWVAFVASLLLFFQTLELPRRAWALAFGFVVLSGGMSWWLVAHHDGGAGPLFQLPHWQQMFIYSRVIHPSFIMYFFQHPIALGLVLLLGMLRCLQLGLEEGNKSALWTGFFLLGVMSLAQVMLFATSLAALGAVFFYRFFQAKVPWRRNLLEGLGALLLCLALAFALGGFFRLSAGAESQPLHWTWPPGYLRNEFYAKGRGITWLQTLIWYFSGFGLVLILIPFAWVQALRRPSGVRVFLGIFSILSFLVPHFLQYAFSWDIVKWFFAFEFSGRLLAAWAFWPWIARAVWRQILAAALILFGMVTPLRFLTELSLRPMSSFSRAELRIAGYLPPRASGSLGKLIAAMKSSPEYYGTVWSSASTSLGLALHTGFPMLQVDFNTVAMPVGRSRIEQRQEILKTLAANPSRQLLAELGVRWVIFSCRETKGLSPVAQNFLEMVKIDPLAENFSQSGGGNDCFLAYRFK